MAVPTIDLDSEWLESDGLGGFASGTTLGVATRRYHALLLAARTPPSGRLVLVNGFSAWLETPHGELRLTQHYFAPDVLTTADARIESFTTDPWPTWRYVTLTGLVIVQELFALHDSPTTCLRFRLEGEARGVKLCIRPFLSGRDFHATHHETQHFAGMPIRAAPCCVSSPIRSCPASSF